MSPQTTLRVEPIAVGSNQGRSVQSLVAPAAGPPAGAAARALSADACRPPTPESLVRRLSSRESGRRPPPEATGFEGLWLSSEGGETQTIQGNRCWGSDGERHHVSYPSESRIELTLHGEVHRGELKHDDGHIYWDDGDTWQKQANCCGEAPFGVTWV